MATDKTPEQIAAEEQEKAEKAAAAAQAKADKAAAAAQAKEEKAAAAAQAKAEKDAAAAQAKADQANTVKAAAATNSDALLARIETNTAALVNADEKVWIFIQPKDKNDKICRVGINGHWWNIKKGVPVQVPKPVAEIIRQSEIVLDENESMIGHMMAGSL